jgi:hypothetical protein
VFSTEAVGGIVAFEASHTSDPAIDAAMVLSKTIVDIPADPGSAAGFVTPWGGVVVVAGQRHEFPSVAGIAKRYRLVYRRPDSSCIK